MHPPQAELAAMMQTAGFGQCRYVNMLGGIVALHGGVRL
jgi:demethylmenaquinone methyltransferase/2-methoxy-6-polyprenyl-1,4-benzoquinol methylase